WSARVGSNLRVRPEGRRPKGGGSKRSQTNGLRQQDMSSTRRSLVNPLAPRCTGLLRTKTRATDASFTSISASRTGFTIFVAPRPRRVNDARAFSCRSLSMKSISRRFFAFAAIAAIFASSARAADNPFVGDWKLNPSRSKLTDVMKVESLGGDK